MTSLVDSFLQHMHHTSAVNALLLVALGMMLESTLVPLPSEIMLPVTGIWAADGKFGPGWVGFCVAMVVVTVGSLAGSAISYAIGHYGGRPLIERFGRFVLVTPRHIDHAEKWLTDHGAWSIAVGRVAFGIRHVQSIVAGALHMPLGRFMLATAIGCTLWNVLGVFLGFRYGKAIEHLLRNASLVMLGIVIAGIVISIVVASRKAHDPAKP